MSYYQDNRATLLKKLMTNITIKVAKKKLLCVIKKTKKQ